MNSCNSGQCLMELVMDPLGEQQSGSQHESEMRRWGWKQQTEDS